jgi:hypothetical protein
VPTPESSPDLDLRPGEPARGTLAQWTRACPSCAAAGDDLAALPDNAAATVGSAEYVALADTPLPGRIFLRASLIAREAGDSVTAADMILRAAWAADDAGDAADAARLRTAAASAWGEPHSEERALRLIDVLRRSGDFAGAEARAASLETATQDENTRRIAAYQRARAAARDDGRHLLASALRPPARTPHVAHGRAAARPGLWARLTRGR